MPLPGGPREHGQHRQDAVKERAALGELARGLQLTRGRDIEAACGQLAAEPQIRVPRTPTLA